MHVFCFWLKVKVTGCNNSASSFSLTELQIYDKDDNVFFLKYKKKKIVQPEAMEKKM